jgi:hypothetical protein
VCSDALLFSSYQVDRDSYMMMRNGLHASIHGVGIVDLKLTSRKIVPEEYAACPFYQQESS